LEIEADNSKWESGKKYTYKLKISNPVSTPTAIAFDTEVEDLDEKVIGDQSK